MHTRAAASRTLRRGLDLYLASLHLRPASAALARGVLADFFGHLRRLGVRDLRAVREEQLTSFACRLRTRAGTRGRALAVSTQRTFLSTLRAFFAFVERSRLVSYDPSRALPLPTLQQLPGAVPSEAQVRRLLQAPFPGSVRGKRDRAILEVLYGTGLRVGECARLDLLDVDLAGGTLLVRNGKGRKDRVVPVCGRAARAIDTYCRQARSDFRKSSFEPALFLSTRGGRLTRGAIERRVRALRSAIQSPIRISPHTLRHACATHMLKGGASIRHLQALLGHRRLETTALYTRVHVQDLAEVLERAHPRELAWKRRKARR